LCEYNISREEAVKEIKANRHTQITTTYFLLLKSFITKGGRSIADKFSKEFIDFSNLSNDEKK